MAKAEYLAKYLSGGEKKTKTKKKSKKSREGETGTQSSLVKVSVSNDGIETPNFEDDENGDGNDENDEDGPVSVSESVFKENKGFKRIDTGEVLTQMAKTSDRIELERTQQQAKTVIRDSTGAVVDLEQRRRQIQDAKREGEAREAELKQSLNKGELQKIDEEQRQRLLESSTNFLISKNDKEYNEIMKEKARFDDPMLMHANLALEPGGVGGAAAAAGAGAVATSKTGRFYYNKGLNPANRFNIKAGFFWDGIDRSNGFELLALRKMHEQAYSKLSTTDSYDELDLL